MALKKFVDHCIGLPNEFSMENRVYNSANLIVFSILSFFLILDMFFRRTEALLLIIPIFIIQAAFYYLSRFRKQAGIGIIGNGILSYVALSINFFYDGGTYGHTLFLSFLSFQLIIAVTGKKQHIFWIALNICFAFALIGMEYRYPQLIKKPYTTTKMYAVDMALSYTCTFIFIYFITRFLGKNYTDEKALTERHLKTIEKQKASIALSEAKLRAFFNSSSSAHILIGVNNEILDFNSAAIKYVQQTQQLELAKFRSIYTFITPGYREEFNTRYLSALKGTAAYTEIKTGETWWALSFEPAHGKTGNITGITFNATDISERKLQEEKIRARNEALTKIAFIQSHELRGPVTTIIGFMNLIRDDDYDQPKEYLQMMETAIQALDDKIHIIIRETEKLP